jgi:hypothetical protein
MCIVSERFRTARKFLRIRLQAAIPSCSLVALPSVIEVDVLEAGVLKSAAGYYVDGFTD